MSGGDIATDSTPPSTGKAWRGMGGREGKDRGGRGGRREERRGEGREEGGEGFSYHAVVLMEAQQ